MKKPWPQVRLGEVLRRVERYETRDELTEYPFAGTYSFARGIFVGERKLGSTFALPRIQRIREGDFIYCKIMAWEGAFGIAPKETDNCVMSGAFVVYELNRARIDPQFLDYFFKVPAHWQNIGRHSTGTNVRRQSLHPTQFEKAEIPLPPLAEQRRIVTRIDELAAQIHEAQSLRQQAAQEAEALVVRYAAVIFDAIGNRARLGDICDTSSGGTPSRDRADFFTGDIPWIKSGELKDDYIDKAEEHITEQAVQSSSAKRFPSGTVLVALYGANVGKTGILSIEATTNQAVCAIFPTKVLDRDFIWWFLRRMRPVFVEDSFGGAQPNISQKIIRDTKIPVPPLPDQRRIVAELAALQAEVDALKKLQAETAAELDALLPSLLDRAFKGTL